MLLSFGKNVQAIPVHLSFALLQNANFNSSGIQAILERVEGIFFFLFSAPSSQPLFFFSPAEESSTPSIFDTLYPANPDDLNFPFDETIMSKTFTMATHSLPSSSFLDDLISCLPSFSPPRSQSKSPFLAYGLYPLLSFSG